MEFFFFTMQYLIVSIPFVLAIVLPIVGVWLLISAVMRPTVGAWVAGSAMLLSTLFVAAPAVPLGINVSTDDLAFVLLFCAAVIRLPVLAVAARNSTLFWLWVAFGGVVLLSLAIGLLTFGSSAGVEVRDNFYFWAAGLYFASFTYSEDQLHRLWRVVQYFAWMMVLIVVYRWVGVKLGFVSESLVLKAGASSEFRVVGSSVTFFLAAVGVVHFAMWLKRSTSRDLLAALCLLGFVLVLQHRSVWVSVLGALVVVMWHLRTEVSRKVFPLIVIGLTTLSMVAIMVVLNPDSRLAETILKSAVSVTQAQGTHVDRLLGWEALLNDFVATASPHQWLVGKPYGSGFARWVMGHLKEYAPHNFYVVLLLRVGIVGILLLMTVHLWLRRRVALKTAEESDGVVRAALLGLLAAFLLYYIPYQGVPFQGALYGVLIAVFGARIAEGGAAERSTLEVAR